jgi:hypothetical protein
MLSAIRLDELLRELRHLSPDLARSLMNQPPHICKEISSQIHESFRIQVEQKQGSNTSAQTVTGPSETGPSEITKLPAATVAKVANIAEYIQEYEGSGALVILDNNEKLMVDLTAVKLVRDRNSVVHGDSNAIKGLIMRHYGQYFVGKGKYISTEPTLQDLEMPQVEYALSLINLWSILSVHKSTHLEESVSSSMSHFFEAMIPDRGYPDDLDKVSKIVFHPERSSERAFSRPRQILAIVFAFYFKQFFGYHQAGYDSKNFRSLLHKCPLLAMTLVECLGNILEPLAASSGFTTMAAAHKPENAGTNKQLRAFVNRKIEEGNRRHPPSNTNRSANEGVDEERLRKLRRTASTVAERMAEHGMIN